MANETLNHIPLDLKDIVTLGKQMLENGKSPAEIKSWLGDYHPPIYRYAGTDDYYDFMRSLCQECGDTAEAGRLSHLHAIVNEDHQRIQAKEKQFETLLAQYFQSDDDTQILEELSKICYETSRFLEHVIIEILLSQPAGSQRQLHETARYRINMSYFIEQIKRPGLWLLPTEPDSLLTSELLGNLLSRLGHRVFLILPAEAEEIDMLPPDSELLALSMDRQQEYTDMTVIPAVCVRDKTGRSKDNTVLLLRYLCKSVSETDYANILAAGKKFDILQQTEIKKILERLSRYEGEIFQPYMAYGRLGDYMSYLEQIYQEPLHALLNETPSCKFSIVIPASNSAKYLQHTVKTCLNQRYQGNYEILISDNSEEGNSQVWELCQKLKDKRIRYIKVPKTVDLVKSFEYACLHARGEYFFSIGSDDGILPWTLQVLDEVTTQYPNYSVIRWDVGNYMWPDYDGSRLLRANMIFVPHRYEKGNYHLSRLNIENVLLDAMQMPSAMYSLPSSYINSCYKKSFLKQILIQTGRLRNGLCHDIYMGVVVSALKQEVLSIGYPLVIAAQSGISWGARSNFTFDNDLKVQKNEHALLIGMAALSPFERYLPEINMDFGLLYQCILRMVSLGCLPQEMIQQLNWKTIYKNVYEQYPKNKIVYDELIHRLRYAARNLGDEFLKWFDREIYEPGKEKYRLTEEMDAYTGWEDTVTESGCVALTLDKYGVKNIFDAVKIFEVITEL